MGGVVLVVVIILLLYGGSKLPDVGRGLGKAISEFRRSVSESRDQAPKDKNRKD